MAIKEELRKIELLEIGIDLLRRIERNTRPAYIPAVAIELSIKNLTTGQLGDRDMKLQLNESAEIKVKAIKDAAGNPASVEGDKLDWAVKGDQSLGDLQVGEDGKSAIFVRNGAVGSCTVQVSGDADLGPDTKTIMGEVVIDCLGGEAVVFELEANAIPAVTPEPTPAPEPTPEPV